MRLINKGIHNTVLAALSFVNVNRTLAVYSYIAATVMLKSIFSVVRNLLVFLHLPFLTDKRHYTVVGCIVSSILQDIRDSFKS